jgi:SNF2 family DNA or RNA helicase
VLQICGGNLAVHTEKEGEYSTVPIKGKNAKLDYILSDLEETQQQCIVWACFRAEIDLLHFELGKKHSVVAMSGDTPKQIRAANIERFKTGEARILVAHPEVGGYGLNLQNAGLQYWYSRSYRTESRLQAEDRSHRIGTVRSPIYKDLVYNSVFEKNVLDVLREGADINSRLVSASLNDLFKIE